MDAHRKILERARAVQGSAQPVPSPCMSVCRMDVASSLCEGCLRTLDEIITWSSLDEAGRRCVWQRLEQRAGALA